MRNPWIFSKDFRAARRREEGDEAVSLATREGAGNEWMAVNRWQWTDGSELDDGKALDGGSA